MKNEMVGQIWHHTMAFQQCQGAVMYGVRNHYVWINFFQQLMQANIKESIKASRHWVFEMAIKGQ